MRKFFEMGESVLCAEFVDLPWTIDDLLDRNYKAVREGASVPKHIQKNYACQP